MRIPVTDHFRAPDGSVIPGSIAESAFVRLGGVDQWVLIRGENAANPPLVILHGGPGLSETVFFRHCNAVLERCFTCVYWDQRGAGMSASPAIPVGSMTTEQFLADLDELVDHTRRRLGAEKVTILGHSWGSVLGVLYAARHPEKVTAYVGCAQIGNWREGEMMTYVHALAEAERLNKRWIAKKLRELGPPPHSPDDMYRQRSFALLLSGTMPKTLWSSLRMAIAVREASVFDMLSAQRAFMWTLRAMWPEVSQIDLLARVPQLTVPTFFLLGRQDPWVRPEASTAFIEALAAPSKDVVWFEDSGHEPFVDEPQKFNDVMRERVLPVVIRSTLASCTARPSSSQEPARASAR